MILINTRLKILREEKGYAQLKVAMDMNMNQNSVSRYENGEREADYQTLIDIAELVKRVMMCSSSLRIITVFP